MVFKKINTLDFFFTTKEAAGVSGEHSLLTTGNKKEYSWRKMFQKSDRELLLFSKLMFTLLKAKLPLTESLTSVYNQIKDPAFKGITKSIIRDVRSGSSLAASMRRYPGYFDEFYSSVIEAGERNGGLDTTFNTVYNYLIKRSTLRKKVSSALIYPVFLLVFSVVAVFFLSMVVLPTFSGIYDSFDRELPGVTRFVLWNSQIVRSYWYMILGLIAVSIYTTAKYLKDPSGRLKADSFLMGFAPFRGIIYKKEIGSFFPLLSLSLKSGMDIVSALRISNKTVFNTRLKMDMEEVVREVIKGRKLSSALEGVGFPSLAIQFITTGESSNNLEEMLDSVSEYYLMELEESIEVAISLIEPVMIIVVGTVVAVIVMAIMLPILSLSTAII